MDTQTIKPIPLSAREQQIVTMLTERGMRQIDIARELHFSVAYIYEITKRIRGKFCIGTTNALIAQFNGHRGVSPENSRETT